MFFIYSRQTILISSLISTLFLLALTGCHVGPQVRRADRTSSIVDYLYPGNEIPAVTADVPVLRLPLRVGIAFVPSASNTAAVIGGGNVGTSEFAKEELLQRVARAFAGRDYINSIEIVPSTYLRPQGGFLNLDQLQRLLHVDVIALVSYDQLQFTDANRLSLSYWTIVGAYLVKGNKNDTQTMMEASVYDISSRHLLFRAPGTAHVHAESTLVQVNEKLRRDSVTSLNLAADDMIKNLTLQLEDFRSRIKQTPETVARIEHKPGYTGAGDLGLWLAFGVLGAMLWSVRAVRR